MTNTATREIKLVISYIGRSFHTRASKERNSGQSKRKVWHTLSSFFKEEENGTKGEGSTKESNVTLTDTTKRKLEFSLSTSAS
jgi:hypothetical protein